MTKSTAVLAFALAAVSTGNAFLAPSGLHTARTASQSSTVMRAEKPNAGASAAAAVVAAGVLLQGAMAGPVQAANFETAAAAPTTYLAGFGLPNPSSDPENNNAASGKTNGDKYNVQQQGSFAKKYADGNAADYGSPKGTDFGPTAGNSPNAASSTKGTAGAYREDAESPENQGKVNIASKNTKDAANLDVKSVAKNPNAVKGPNPADAKSSVASAAGKAKTVAKKATSGSFGDIFSSNGGNPSTSGSDPGAGFNFGVVPSAEKAAKGPADNVRAEVKKNGGDNAKAGKGPASIGVTASNAAGGLKKSINEGKNIVASATGAVSEAGDSGRNAATRAADTAANKVSKANAGGVGGAAQSVAQAGANKVGAGADAAKQAGNKVKSEASNLASANLGSEGNQAKNDPAGKVQKDINIAKNKVGDDLNTVAKNTPNAPEAGGFFNDPRGQQEAVRQKTADKVKGDVNAVTGSSVNLSLGNLGSEANQAKNNPAGKVQKDLNVAKNKVRDDIDTVAKNAPNAPKAGGFFSDPRGQQEAVRQKTAGKVKSDVNAVTGNSINLSLGNLGGEANQAKNNPLGKVQKDINTAKNKAQGGLSGIGNLGGEANQAKNNPLGKVQKDLNVAKNKVQGGVSGINNNTPDVGGLFGKDSDKQAQKTGSKTVDKVKGDLNQVKSAVESARNEGVTTQFSSSINLSVGNIGGEANQAKNNPLGKVQKDINTAKNKAQGGLSGIGNLGGEANQAKNNPLGKVQKDLNVAKNKAQGGLSGIGNIGNNSPDVGGLFGKDSDKQAQKTGSKTVDKVSRDVNEVKKAVESVRNEGVATKFSS